MLTPLMHQAPEFSIVLPVYNEEDNLKTLADGILNAMTSDTRSYEVIFVDYGSTDGIQ